MRAEPADHVSIPLPHTLANNLARMPEQQRGDLHVLSQMLRDYLATRDLPGTVHPSEADQHSYF